MKILLVSPFLPSPPRFGGQRRIDGLARGLAQRHELSVLAFNRTDEFEASSVQATREYCKEVLSVPNFEVTDLTEKRRLQLRSLGSPYSYEHSLASRRNDFKFVLKEVLRATRYDVVQYEFMQMAAFRFPDLGRAAPLWILDEHNVEYDVLKRTASEGSDLKRRVYNALNWRKLAREERAAWRRFDGIALTSRRDQQLLQAELPGARSAVVPNGVDVSAFVPNPAAVEPKVLLFFGAINYQPNHDGVIYFIDRILPKIRERHPEIKLRILGPGAREEVLARQGNGVEVLGMVDDVGPHIDRAAAVVVPLRIGGGTRLKIVEALAKGKALISTRLGAEGLDVAHDEQLLLADEPEEFARQVDRVLTEPGLAARLGQRGRQLMEEKYSWQSIVLGLERFYDECREGRATRSARGA